MTDEGREVRFSGAGATVGELIEALAGFPAGARVVVLGDGLGGVVSVVEYSPSKTFSPEGMVSLW